MSPFWGLVIILAEAVVFGYATQVVIQHKGYDKVWFWWGFFFGLIALIVACLRPRNKDYSPAVGVVPQSEAQAHDAQILADGGWTCSCGKVHAGYVSSCSCGKQKREILEAQ